MTVRKESVPVWITRGALARAGAAIVVLAVLVVLAFTLAPAPLFVLQNVVGLVLFAVATNLLLGFGGIVSFGQAAFYGLGAYVVALSWAHDLMPFWAAFFVAPVAGAVAALLVGSLALRTRRLYFALLTLAFSQLFFTIAEKWYGVTQGDNGIFGAMIPTALSYPRAGFLFVLAVVVVSLLVLWKVTVSPFGLTLRATRENRDRAQALGVNVYRHQLLAFAISGFFCALSGVLFTVHSQSAYPQLLDWTQSGDPIFMCVLGGMYSFLGPAIGAFIYQYGHDLTIQYTKDWQFVLGLVLLLVVLFAPSGLVGLFRKDTWRGARGRLASIRQWPRPWGRHPGRR